jgi:hypothetical protein
LQQQSARYFGPHDRNNASPSAGNLTVLNSSSPHCYTPLGPATADSLLNRPSCLTCPTIGSHNCADHPAGSSVASLSTNFHQFHNHHTNMPPHQHQHPITTASSSSSAALTSNKNLMRNHHANMFDTCQK